MSRFHFIVVGLIAILLAASAVTVADEVTLTLALRESVDTLAVYEEIIEDFEREHPGIKVNINNVGSTEFNENVLVQVAAGVPPDVLYVHYGFFPELARQGLLLDVSEYIERDNYDLTDFFPPTLEQLTWEGKFGYALPRETSTTAIFYNKDKFDSSGLEYPTDDWTYDDMAHLARRLSRRESDGQQAEFGLYGLQFWYHWPNIFWSMGADILNEDGTEFALHRSEGVNAVQWMTDLVIEGSATTNWAYRFASVGTSAMEIVNFWHIQQNVQNSFEWDAVLPPTGPAGKVTRSASGGHGIMAGTKHPDEAWELLKFLSSTETQNRLAAGGTIIPARRSSAVDPDFLDGPPENRIAFITSIEYARVDNIPEKVNNLMQGAFASLWNGEKSAQVLLEELRPVVNEMLREINQ